MKVTTTYSAGGPLHRSGARAGAVAAQDTSPERVTLGGFVERHPVLSCSAIVGVAGAGFGALMPWIFGGGAPSLAWGAAGLVGGAACGAAMKYLTQRQDQLLEQERASRSAADASRLATILILRQRAGQSS